MTSNNLVHIPTNPDDVVTLAVYDFRGLRTTKGWTIYWDWRLAEVLQYLGS